MAIKVHDWKAEAEALEFDDIEERLAYYAQLRDGKAAEQRKRAIAEVKELMAKHRVSPDDLVEPKPGSTKKAPSAGRKMAPKYRNPENQEEVWTGQGRAPRWMPENKEQWTDFLIKSE